MNSPLFIVRCIVDPNLSVGAFLQREHLEMGHAALINSQRNQWLIRSSVDGSQEADVEILSGRRSVRRSRDTQGTDVEIVRLQFQQGDIGACQRPDKRSYCGR